MLLVVEAKGVLGDLFWIFAGKPAGQILHSPKSYIENLLPVEQIATPQNESAWHLDVRVCSENSRGWRKHVPRKFYGSWAY